MRTLLGFKFVNRETNFLVVIFCERDRERAIFTNILLSDPIIETFTWKLITIVSEKSSTSIFGVKARQIGIRAYYIGMEGGWSPASHCAGSSSSPDARVRYRASARRLRNIRVLTGIFHWSLSSVR
jgi:hypothetical protein